MWRSLGLGSLVAATLVLMAPGCSSVKEDGRDDSFLGGGGKGDTGGIAEGTYEAQLVLGVANTASLEVLGESPPEGVGLSQRTVDNIGNVRLGDDGLPGTADDGRFRSLAELDAVPFVGPIAFEKLLAYAERNSPAGLDLGWQPEWDLSGPHGNDDGGAPATWDLGGPVPQSDGGGPQPTWDLGGPWAYDAGSTYFGSLPKQWDGSVFLNGSAPIAFYKNVNGDSSTVDQTLSCSLYGPSVSSLQLSCVTSFGSSWAPVNAVDGSLVGYAGGAYMVGTVSGSGTVTITWFSMTTSDGTYYSSVDSVSFPLN